jgi:hypothetical protein
MAQRRVLEWTEAALNGLFVCARPNAADEAGAGERIGGVEQGDAAYSRVELATRLGGGFCWEWLGGGPYSAMAGSFAR